MSPSSLQIGGRPLSTILRALTQKHHYHALRRMFEVYPRPLEMLRRYLLKTGHYPTTVEVDSPLGRQPVRLYSHHDFLTLNEIFCREDYRASSSLRWVVDIGSNIGISALYFLTRDPECHVFLYEPVPANVTKLQAALKKFASRYEIQQVCVGTHTGSVEFGLEETGRYGGIGVATGRSATFPCRDINEILSEVLSRPQISRIDLLKIDVEGLEWELVHRIEARHLEKIDTIYAEIPGEGRELPGFRQRQRGTVSLWTHAKQKAEEEL